MSKTNETLCHNVVTIKICKNHSSRIEILYKSRSYGFSIDDCQLLIILPCGGYSTCPGRGKSKNFRYNLTKFHIIHHLPYYLI